MTALRDLIELVRAPAALSVPGDVIAGAAAGQVLGPRTLGLACSSVCLYWAGMAANDWADRHLDAAERPERPIPSGRVRPGAALGLAAGLTAAGLAVAGLSGGRRALLVAAPLAGAVWTYDLVAKNTPAGPLAMAVCRGLDVLLGATQPAGRPAPPATARTPGRHVPPEAARSPGPAFPAALSAVLPPGILAALPAALTIAAHTYLLTDLSRGETTGTGRHRPAATLAGTLALAVTTACHRAPDDDHHPPGPAASPPPGAPTHTRPGPTTRPRPGVHAGPLPGVLAHRHLGGHAGPPSGVLARLRLGGHAGPDSGATAGSRPGRLAGVLARFQPRATARVAARAALAAWYASQFATPQARAVADPSAGQVRAAVTAGIVSLPALQGALTARAGAPAAGLALAAVVPLARRLARKLSPT